MGYGEPGHFAQVALSPLPHDSDTWLAVLAQMPVAVLVAEVPSGCFLWFNSRAEELMGHPVIPVAGAGDYGRYGGEHEDGSPYEAQEYPLARAARNGEVVDRELLRYRRGDGRLAMLEISASRVRGPQGQPVAVCTFQDVTAQHEARLALQETAERVDLALDAGAIVGTWVWDLVANRFTGDERFAQSFRLDPERCRIGLERDEVLASVHPDDRPGLEAAIEDALARGGAYRHQYRLLQASSLDRWVEASGRVEQDARGKPVRFPGVLVDITAWKQGEETRNLLMREVDHRARNALATVQSVVRLTEASDPARYRNEVIGRVDALARAQGTLSRSNWSGGLLEDLVREEISSCASAEQFRLAGPTVTLPADQVQPLNMMIHELGTNALKYGALSVHSGKVEVKWSVDKARQVTLAWRERGGPPVEPPTRTGFGSRLIGRLANQLGGAVKMDWRAAGLVATLSWRA